MLYRNGAGTSYSYQAGNYRLEEMITTDKNGNEIQNLLLMVVIKYTKNGRLKVYHF